MNSEPTGDKVSAGTAGIAFSVNAADDDESDVFLDDDMSSRVSIIKSLMVTTYG